MIIIIIIGKCSVRLHVAYLLLLRRRNSLISFDLHLCLIYVQYAIYYVILACTPIPIVDIYKAKTYVLQYFIFGIIVDIWLW
jgi:hypothetical protein